MAGDICIVWQDDPRKNWKKARILSVIKSKDGNIRSCKVKMDTGVTIRSVNQLYHLEITTDSLFEANKDNCKKGVKKKGKITQPIVERPPRRAAAQVAINRNRELLLQDHYFI